MPLKDKRVADPEVKRMRCWKCDGILSPETAIDLDSGVPVELDGKTGYCRLMTHGVNDSSEE